MTCERRRGRRLIASALVVLLFQQGCAFVDKEGPMWWRDGVVVRTMPRSELPTDIDAGCVPVGTASAPVGHSDRFAIVQFRVGKAPYPKVFPIDANQDLQPGDHVVVEPRACKIKARAL